MMRHVGVARTARQRKQQHFVADINFYLLYAGSRGQLAAKENGIQFYQYF